MSTTRQMMITKWVVGEPVVRSTAEKSLAGG